MLGERGEEFELNSHVVQASLNSDERQKGQLEPLDKSQAMSLPINSNAQNNIEVVLSNAAQCTDSLVGTLNCIQKSAGHVSEIGRQLQATVSALSESYEKLIAAAQSNAFESVRRFAQLSSEIISSQDGYRRLARQIGEFHKTAMLVGICKRTQWPLYLEDNDALLNGLLKMNVRQNDAELETLVDDLAFGTLDSVWLNEVKQRWTKINVINLGEKALLLNALEKHATNDFTGCVSILMCMFEGFAERFVAISGALTDIGVERFNREAEARRLNNHLKEGGRLRKLYAKDNILLLYLQSDQGGFVCEAAFSYITSTVLTNRDDEELMKRNPLRNKICHGIQTNYGTRKHSLKAILAIDMLLRMGALATAASEAELDDA